jgi:hypothetical protein
MLPLINSGSGPVSHRPPLALPMVNAANQDRAGRRLTDALYRRPCGRRRHLVASQNIQSQREDGPEPDGVVGVVGVIVPGLRVQQDSEAVTVEH